jgi:dipeptidyl-peptidase-4
VQCTRSHAARTRSHAPVERAWRGLSRASRKATSRPETSFRSLRRFPFRAAGISLALALLQVLAVAVSAQDKREITVEWIFSDAGEEPTRLPPFAWATGGDLLLLDTRKPKDERTFERVTPAGSRTAAVDRAAAWSSLKGLLGESALPETLEWPASLDRAGRRGAYVFADDLFLLDLGSSRFERLTRTADKEEIPRLAPDGTKLAFVRDNDLYVLDLATRAESRLTRDGSASVLNGALSWVYWEEVFDHEEAGFWWSPDGSAIAFLRTDESAVSTTEFVDFEPVVPRVLTQRYPEAGGANPAVRLGIVDVASGVTAWMDPDAAPFEYVVAVEWSPDGRRVAVQTEDRPQNRLDLYFVDRRTGQPTRVLTETDAAWTNTHDLEFLEKGEGFLWSSERDGYTHLYRYRADGTLLNAVTKGPWSVRGPGSFTTAPFGAIAAVDEGRGLVYFTALKKSPVERQLYRARLDGTGIERLSREDGVHHPTFSPDARSYVDAWSAHATLPSLSLHDADGVRKADLAPARTDLLAGLDVQYPELLTVPADDGTPLQASLLKPKTFDRARRYPVILHVYGGPGAPRVLDRWDGSLWFDELLLKEGYVVAAVDNRSATAASWARETSVARRLWGEGELADLLAGVRWLKAQPWVDPERVGIWGWSGGGMFTLVALTRSKEFEAGIAVAPGTDWRYYDTKFTEAYMKPPPENPVGYEDTSVVRRAKDLHGRLLLVFGTHDDNVHPQNSWAFVNELVAAGIPLEMMVYPMRKHGIEDRPARIHLFRRMLGFWKERL